MVFLSLKVDGNMTFADYWKVLFWSFREWEIRYFFQPKSWWKDNIYRLLKSSYFDLFGNGKCGLFLSQKVDGKMIFTDYWKVLVLNFSMMGNTVFFWVKKLMERWYLLVTEKFLFWTFRWWEIRSFLSAKKLMERWYLLGLFELSMIFQDLGNMVFCTVFFVLDVFLLAGALTSFHFNVL